MPDTLVLNLGVETSPSSVERIGKMSFSLAIGFDIAVQQFVGLQRDEGCWYAHGLTSEMQHRVLSLISSYDILIKIGYFKF